MDQVDFDFIEANVGVVLPEVFKRFMRQFPNDSGHQLNYRAFDQMTIPTNAELFAIAQLRKFRSEPCFDYYEHQSELLPRRFLNIGDEGNGDFYCMVGDDLNSGELWVWRHDSFATPLFVLCHDQTCLDRREKLGLPLGTTLQTYLSSEWVLVPQADPFAEVPNRSKTICRSNHPLRSILNPIGLQEWREYIAKDPQFELDEIVEFKDPFTGKLTQFTGCPGRVNWKLGDFSVSITYQHGCLNLASSAPANLTKVQVKTWRGIARDLNAKLF